MDNQAMGAIEARFADIIWQNEPISSGDLAKKSEELLSWKKSTSFTVLRRLCQKGLFKRENGVVTSLIKRDAYYSMRCDSFVEEAFGGSLPAFLTAFSKRRALSPEDIKQLRNMIAAYENREV